MIPFVFFGSDEFAVGVLEELKNKELIPALIITTAGSSRRGVVLPSLAQTWAEKNRIEFTLDTGKLGANNYQLFIVASYGKILKPEILNLATKGCLNVHPSLLPKYRGPSPLQSAILNGDQETGVTIIKLDEQMDHGPILTTASCQLKTESFVELRDQLAKMGADLLAQILPDYLAGKIKLTEQKHDQATFTKKFSKADAELKTEDPPELKFRKVLALNPEPGTWLIDSNNLRLKIFGINNILTLKPIIIILFAFHIL
jgi:methionyl-tRNA formyltransferase